MADGGLGFGLGTVEPGLVHGIARLTAMLYAGRTVEEVLALLGPEPAADGPARAGWLMDRAWVGWLSFSPDQAQALQDRALALHRVFRVRGTAGIPVVALCAPGGLMVNAPLDFIAGPAGLRLDLVFTTAAGRVPAVVPAHDVAVVAASESAPEALRGLAAVFDGWPRPILNDPRRVLPMSRAGLPRLLAGVPGLLVPPAREVGLSALSGDWTALLPGGHWPLLVRPLGSHAGQGLVRVEAPADAARFVGAAADGTFTLTQFVDYRGAAGWYAGTGSPSWMGVRSSATWPRPSIGWCTTSMRGWRRNPGKRAAEAAAMAGFAGFRARHRAALDGLAAAIGLAYFSIDCAEAPDGRLLVFEADTAAILHSMDPPALFPYKAAAMQSCYDAFGAMIRARAAG